MARKSSALGRDKDTTSDLIEAAALSVSFSVRLTIWRIMTIQSKVYEERADYSLTQLTTLRTKLRALPELADFNDLTIFGAGSYARLEASQYSDIDMFFLSVGGPEDVREPRTRSYRLFGKVIEIVDDMGFPKFSNDGQYLALLPTNDIVAKLGTPIDDKENYFTARMLLLLESHCLYGDDAFRGILAKVVASYFKDFPDHPQTFQPIFLLNDICRFWKTMLLNYESRRTIPKGPDAGLESRKTRHKVRNFKLKYSRMTTCFASIAALSSHLTPVTQEDVIAIVALTPRQRLESIVSRVPEVGGAVDEILDRYAWFLEMTGLPTEELESHFSDKQKRTEMFHRANEYGDSMFKLLQALDETHPTLKLVRTLVI